MPTQQNSVRLDMSSNPSLTANVIRTMLIQRASMSEFHRHLMAKISSTPHRMRPNEDVEVANMEGVETPVMDRDAEQMQADDAVDIAFAAVDDTGYESDAAEMFMDDGDGMDVGEDRMVMALTTAGVTVEKTKICAASMCKRIPNNDCHQSLWAVDQGPIFANTSQPQCRRRQCP